MVYGDHQVKNKHPSPSWASNIILTRWSIAKNYCALLCCCRLFVVLSCGSVSFEYKQVVKALLIFHRPAAEGLGWWWGEENEFLQYFYASIHPSEACHLYSELSSHMSQNVSVSRHGPIRRQPYILPPNSSYPGLQQLQPNSPRLTLIFVQLTLHLVLVAASCVEF